MNRNRRPRPVLYIGPRLNDDDPPAAKEAATRRRLVAITGRCPCGAELGEPFLAADGLWHAEITHASDCPALLGVA